MSDSDTPGRASGEQSTPDASQKAQPARKSPPSPYLVTLILFALAAWFLYDGFFNPEIKAVWFNRIGGVLFLVAGIWDGLRQRRLAQARAERQAAGSQPLGGTGSG